MSDESGISIESRCERAGTVLEAFNHDEPGEESEFVDIIADLLHLISRDGYNGETIIRMALQHYEEERDDG